MPVAQTLGSERREYFRINDEVALQYRLIEEDEVRSRLEGREAGQLDANAIASSFANSGRQMKHSLEKFRRELPDVATYLDAMSTKMDILVRLLLASNSQLPDHPTHDVNISASGLAFRSKEQLDDDQLIELKLMFFPSCLYLIAYGQVIRSSLDEDAPESFPYACAVEFRYMEESDRDLLIRHVLQKESELLRDARSSPVSNAQ